MKIQISHAGHKQLKFNICQLFWSSSDLSWQKFFFYIILIYKYLPIAPFRLFHDWWKIGNGFTGIVFYNEMFGFQGLLF